MNGNGTHPPSGWPGPAQEFVPAPEPEPEPRRLAAGELARRFPVTLGLTVVTLVFFALEAALGGTADTQAQMRLGVLRADLVFEQGELFRLFCAAFLHHWWIHLGLNWFAFLQLGALTEQIYGSWRLLAVYLACALASSLCSAFFMSPIPGGSRGASGAIMGLAGLLLGASWFAAEPTRSTLRMLFGRRLLFGVLLTFGLGIGLLLLLPIVDNWGHAGGFSLGLLLSLALRRPERPQGPVVKVAAVLLTLATLGSFGWMAVAGGRAAERLPLEEAQAFDAALSDPESYLRRSSGWILSWDEDPGPSSQVEASLLQQMVDLYTHAGRPELGIAALESRLPTLDDPSGDLANLHAWMLVTRADVGAREPARAEGIARQSLDRIPSVRTDAERAALAARLDTLAEALLQQGKLQEAYQAQIQAVDIVRGYEGPIRADLEFRLARICASLGRSEQALEAARAAVGNADPASHDLPEMRAFMKRLQASTTGER